MRLNSKMKKIWPIGFIKMKRFVFTLEDNIYDWLRLKSYDEHIPISQIIRDSLDTLLFLEATQKQDLIMTGEKLHVKKKGNLLQQCACKINKDHGE